MAKKKLEIFKNETSLRKVIKDYFGDRAFFVEHGRFGGSTGVTDCFLTYPDERTVYIELKLERNGKIKVRPSQSRNARLLNKFKQPHTVLVGIEGKSDYYHIRYPEYEIKDEKLFAKGDKVYGKGHKSLIEDIKEFARNPFIEGDFATQHKRATEILHTSEKRIREIFENEHKGNEFTGMDKQLIDQLQRRMLSFVDFMRTVDNSGIDDAIDCFVLISILCSVYYPEEKYEEKGEGSSK